MGLRKRIRWIVLAAIVALAPGLARAQDIGVVAPRTLFLTLFDNVTCVAGLTSVIPDRSLNVHVILWDVSAGITAIDVELEASSDGITYFSILYSPGNGVPHGGTYSAVYMPFVRVRIVSCTGAGTLTLHYSGTWSLELVPPPGLLPSSATNFECPNQPTILTMTGPGTFVAVASAVAAARIHVCTISFSLSAASNVTFVFGTGVDCATGTTSITGAYQNVATFHTAIQPRESFATGTAGTDLCIVLSGVSVLGGYISFREF